MKYDSVAGAVSLAVYDPANGYSQVGSTSTTVAMADTLDMAQFGRLDNHGPLATDTTQSWYGQICIDCTNAAWPLIPSGGTDTTPPSTRCSAGWNRNGHLHNRLHRAVVGQLGRQQ